MSTSFNNELAVSLAKAYDEFAFLFIMAERLPDDERKAVFEIVGEKSDVLKAFDEQRKADSE